MVDNLGPKTVVWRREATDYVLSIGTMMYAPNDEMSIDYRTFPRDRTQWDLIIKRAQPEHSGTYECQISAAKVYTYYVRLTVRAIELQGTEYVNKFSQINLTCNATGATRAPDDIDWFHNGQKIYMKDPKWQERLTITKYQPEIPGRSLISQLLIKRSRISDHGTYICRSSDLNTKSIPVHVLNG
ncbi:hypothetical protein FSP39_005246 [Pinctada imbricata]|uniref:Ig-like domain-containing protein n=1 Tax=Pinctada imbricata TaxID=66713 RepID=A0AA88Y961_PINIB|nr:hypothetical protein FSP39_005246 [Pinctada imbricata]